MTTTTVPSTTPTTGSTTAGSVTFADTIGPLFAAQCGGCHGAQGNWDAGTLESVLTTGDNAPVVVPGNAGASLLAQKIQGIQSGGMQMPPGGLMTEEEIATVIAWIDAGAP